MIWAKYSLFRYMDSLGHQTSSTMPTKHSNPQGTLFTMISFLGPLLPLIHLPGSRMLMLLAKGLYFLRHVVKEPSYPCGQMDDVRRLVLLEHGLADDLLQEPYELRPILS